MCSDWNRRSIFEQYIFWTSSRSSKWRGRERFWQMIDLRYILWLAHFFRRSWFSENSTGGWNIYLIFGSEHRDEKHVVEKSTRHWSTMTHYHFFHFIFYDYYFSSTEMKYVYCRVANCIFLLINQWFFYNFFSVPCKF